MLPVRLSHKAYLLRLILRRIRHRIGQRIAAVAAGEPGLLERTAEQARRRALELLGLAEIQAELEAIAAQRRQLDERQRRAQRAMLAVVLRVPLEEAGAADELQMHPQVARALTRAQAVQEEELLSRHPAGREILRLRRERDSLFEAFWLAAAPRPLKDLWQKVLETLGEEPTELEKMVLRKGAPPGAVSGPGGGGEPA